MTYFAKKLWLTYATLSQDSSAFSRLDACIEISHLKGQMKLAVDPPKLKDDFWVMITE